MECITIQIMVEKDCDYNDTIVRCFKMQDVKEITIEKGRESIDDKIYDTYEIFAVIRDEKILLNRYDSFEKAKNKLNDIFQGDGIIFRKYKRLHEL